MKMKGFTNKVGRYTTYLVCSILFSSQTIASIKPAFDPEKYNKVITNSSEQVATKAIGMDDSMGKYSAENDYISPVDVSAPTALKPLPTEEEVAATANCGCAHAWYNKWGNDLESACLDVEKQSSLYKTLNPNYSDPWTVYWGINSNNSTTFKATFNSNSQIIKMFRVKDGSETDITSSFESGMKNEKLALKGSGDVESGISCKVAFINPIRIYVYKVNMKLGFEKCSSSHGGDRRNCRTEYKTYSANFELTYGPGYFYPPENSCENIFKHAIKTRRISGDSNVLTGLMDSCSYVSRSAY